MEKHRECDNSLMAASEAGSHPKQKNIWVQTKVKDRKDLCSTNHCLHCKKCGAATLINSIYNLGEGEANPWNNSQ